MKNWKKSISRRNTNIFWSKKSYFPHFDGKIAVVHVIQMLIAQNVAGKKIPKKIPLDRGGFGASSPYQKPLRLLAEKKLTNFFLKNMMTKKLVPDVPGAVFRPN